jgi:hypothetical protein
MRKSKYNVCEENYKRKAKRKSRKHALGLPVV